MKKTLLLILLLAGFSHLMAQTNADFLKEINRDIWLPFIEAYGTLDADKYKSLHTTDFIRANGDSKSLPSFAQYFDNSRKWFDAQKQKGNRMEISFAFIERFANGIVGSERGVYKLKFFDNTGKLLEESYGKFHVFLRKQDNKWKIVVDYDSNENNTINEKSFAEGVGLDDFEKFK
jgi:ketosteroid isomerase-like protein